MCASLSLGQDQTTKEECIAKVKEAVAREVGFDTAKAKLKDIIGSFVWKDCYVWVEDLDGKVIGYPVTPALVDKSLRGIKDMNGKMFNAEIIQWHERISDKVGVCL